MFAIYELRARDALRKIRTFGVDNLFGKVEHAAMSISIAKYRSDLKLSLEEFGALFGIRSKGHMSEIERANSCAHKLALAIEAHSNGLVDAATLNADVAAARKAAA